MKNLKYSSAACTLILSSILFVPLAYSAGPQKSPTPQSGSASAISPVKPLTSTPQAVPQASQIIQSGSIKQIITPGANEPQSFVLQEGAEASYVFVVEKPGPVVITVKWDGPPLVVSLLKPNGSTVEQQGVGSVNLTYEAAAIDIQKGTSWGVRLRCAQQPSKSVKSVRKALRAQGTLSVRHTLGASSVQPVVQPKIAVGQEISGRAPDDTFKIGNKTFEKKDKAIEEMSGASKGFADEKAFGEKMKDKVNKGVGGFGGGTSLEDAASQFGGVGSHDLNGQNKGGVILDNGKGTGPNTGGLADHAPGPKDAAGGGGGYSPELDGEVGGFMNIDSMGGVTAGVKGGVSGSNWGASGGSSYNFGGKSWNAHGEGSYSGGEVGGSVTGGANQGTKGSVSGSYKGVGTNSNQVIGVIKGSGGAEKNPASSGDHRNRNPVDYSNTKQGVSESNKKDSRGDYNTKENNDDKQPSDANVTEKPPKDDEGTATAAPEDDGTNDTGGNARDIAKAKAAARQFNGDTGGLGESGWGDKPGANDAQRQTIHAEKANNAAAAVLGIDQKDTEHDPNSVDTQAHGPGYQGLSTDKEILGPTTQPK